MTNLVRTMAALAILLGASGVEAAAPKKARAEAEPAKVEKTYVGASACKRCHGDKAESFQLNAKKARSYAAVEKLEKRLTPDEVKGCYGCHTTGYGKPGGFVSLEETPDLANASCEVCHGPGSAHVKSQAKADIERLPDSRVCEGCHVASRIKAFNYRPVLRAGAH